MHHPLNVLTMETFVIKAMKTRIVILGYLQDPANVVKKWIHNLVKESNSFVPLHAETNVKLPVQRLHHPLTALMMEPFVTKAMKARIVIPGYLQDPSNVVKKWIHNLVKKSDSFVPLHAETNVKRPVQRIHQLKHLHKAMNHPLTVHHVERNVNFPVQRIHQLKHLHKAMNHPLNVLTMKISDMKTTKTRIVILGYLQNQANAV
jgi:hypothetical protein